MKASDTNVLRFVGGLDKVFIIPPFQRNYEWGIEQCNELFEDITNSFLKKKGHYLGNVVYYIGKGTDASYSEFILIDGQQRITTILLLLCALRDTMRKRNIDDKGINLRYLINENCDEKFRVRLKQTSYDATYFDAVVNGKELNPRSKSNIIKNYFHFMQLIEDSDVCPQDIYDTIIKLDIVDVNLQITDDLEMVQTVFEKINSTGRPLSPADLIRNYLLISSSAEEQERLYSEYWVKIEKDLENTDISRFAKDYLILQVFEDVVENDTYKSFKQHFDIEHKPREEILQDMQNYSKYYAWIAGVFPEQEEKSKYDESIRRSLKYLGLLRTMDLYPLCMLLFRELFHDNREELSKILSLLTDFMLRYRIVAPSGGGGALRSAIYKIAEKISSATIQPSFEAIYFELSNSPTPAARFPTDEEFKAKVKESVSDSYIKVLLMRIEEAETKNTVVDINKITREHLMPQTLSPWWVSYLGGDENAKQVHEKYLNCIGNAAPISAGYNSSNSNKTWPEKLNNLGKVQFSITSELVKYKEWKEKDIAERNENMARRACAAICAPLERSRNYESKETTDTFVPGLYPFSDDRTPMGNTRPSAILYDTGELSVSYWTEVLPIICRILIAVDRNLFSEIVNENLLHKRTAKKCPPQKDPIITKIPSYLQKAIKIQGTDYYVEGCLSSERVRVFSKMILDEFGLTDWFQIYVNNN